MTFNVCEACQLYKHCKTPKLPPRGELDNPKVVLIGDAPGETDDEFKMSFTGRSGGMLVDILGDALKDCFLTNIVKCAPYTDSISRTDVRAPTDQEMSYCRTHLFKELQFIPENTILMPLGNVALRGLLGDNDLKITHEVGKERIVNLVGKNFRVIPNYHPSAIFRNQTKFLPDFKKVMHQVFGGGLSTVQSTTSVDTDGKIRLLDFEESMHVLNETIRAFESGQIGWTVFDIETTGFSPWTDRTFMYSIAHDADPNAYAIPLQINNTCEHQGLSYECPPVSFDITPQQAAKLRTMTRLMLETVPIVGHNLKFDVKFEHIGSQVDLDKVRIHADTYIMAHQKFGRSPEVRELSLKALSRHLFSVKEDWEYKIEEYLGRFRFVKDRSYDRVPTSVMGEYAALDSFYNRRLYKHMFEMFQPEELFILNEVTKATNVYVEAETKGICIDTDMLGFVENNYQTFLTKLDDDFRELPTVKRFINKRLPTIRQKNQGKRKNKIAEERLLRQEAFKTSSPKQLLEIIYDKEFYGLAKPTNKKMKTKKGEAKTDAKTIEWLLENTTTTGEAKEFFNGLSRIKNFQKLLSTYVTPVPTEMVEGTYKTRFNLTGTVTGRLSSGFHTMPKHSDIKRIYTSRWKAEGGLFLSGDQSQLEVRVGASIAKEMNIINAYIEGIDVHTKTASIMYKIPLEAVTPPQRDKGKITNFAIFYGKGEENLALDMGISVETARELIAAFLAGNPDLSRWIREQHEFVRKYGFILTPFYRSIHIHEGLSTKEYEVAMAERRSVNYPVQSSASDIVLIAGNEIYQKNKLDKLNSIYMGSVHDSQLVDVYPGEVFKVIQRVKAENEVNVRERFPWILSPLVMNISLGTSWKGAIEFAVKEISDEHVILTGGKGLRKDFHLLKFVASNAYHIDVEVKDEKLLTDKDFDEDRFFRDSVQWKADVLLRKK